MQYFLQGLTMGLAYVAPIGLQNLFVINSALTHNRRRALLTAWIVIFFDVTLAFACFFGIGAVMQRFQWLQMAILFVGSLIVISIGIGLLRAKVEEIDRSKPAQSIPFISGVGTASCLWFTGITLAISLFSDRFNAKTLRIINVVCGVIIVFYGCKLMWNFIQLL